MKNTIRLCTIGIILVMALMVTSQSYATDYSVKSNVEFVMSTVNAPQITNDPVIIWQSYQFSYIPSFHASLIVELSPMFLSNLEKMKVTILYSNLFRKARDGLIHSNDSFNITTTESIGTYFINFSPVYIGDNLRHS